MAPIQAAVKAALVVLCGAIGSVVWVWSSTVPVPATHTPSCTR